MTQGPPNLGLLRLKPREILGGPTFTSGLDTLFKVGIGQDPTASGFDRPETDPFIHSGSVSDPLKNRATACSAASNSATVRSGRGSL